MFNSSCKIMRSAPFKLLILATIAIGGLATGPSRLSRAEPAASTDGAAADTLYLRTEYLPIRPEPTVLPYRLVRELGRQTVLIAARDELGLSTRDETLGEPFPAAGAGNGKVVHCVVRAYADGKARIELTVADTSELLQPAVAVSQAPEKCASYDTYLPLSKLAATFEPMSRSELAKKLGELGFTGKVPPPDESNTATSEALDLLGEMNFASQFAAVRAAHAATSAKGESSSWLGVLVRGYANLAMMARPHWSSDQEVFAARALLYGERMAQLTHESTVSRAHRAYARALVGMHAEALDELEQISPASADAKSDGLPDWFNLIGPYCRFERKPLEDAVKSDAKLAQLAQRMSFEQYRVIDDEHWLFDSGRQTMAACPEDYSVYAALAERTSGLAVKRTGGFYGPAAMKYFLARRVATIPELPDAVRKIAVTKPDALKDPDDPGEQSPFSNLPTHLSRALIVATKNQADRGEPSWSVLGMLIREEQFLQAANTLRVSFDAVEASHKEEAEALLPLIKEHRYSSYIQSFTVDMYHDVATFYQIIDGLNFTDPRANLDQMYGIAWQAYDPDRQTRRGQLAAWHAFLGRNFTLPGMLESLDKMSYRFWDKITPEQQKMLIAELGEISPWAPQVLQWKIRLAGVPNLEQLQVWEKELGDDPQTWVTLAQNYRRLEQQEDAIRCFKKSYDLSPSVQACRGLADSYQTSGRGELWQPTLEAFFKTEDLGLEHASIHEALARGLMKQGKLQEAESHALEAAGTYSSGGLQLASDLYEGLGDWKESEKWIRELSNSYPSYDGQAWYFWCRRTGRGDVEAARVPAKQYFTTEIKKEDDGLKRQLVYDLMEDNPQAALVDGEELVKMSESQNMSAEERIYAQLHFALVAKSLNHEESVRTSVASARRIAEEQRKESYEMMAAVGEAVCDQLSGKPLDHDRLNTFDQLLASAPEGHRCNFDYFIGRALELTGDVEHADSYYKDAVSKGPYDKYNAALAGYYVTKRNGGTSRP
jgi:tetratricopeptide (TPR) repeat protein